MVPRRLLLALVALAVAVAGCSRSSDDPPRADRPPAAAEGGLGDLTFPVAGGSPEARRHFQRGILALHSFWYDEATRSFQAAIDADRTFSMAYWGLAMSQAKILWGDDRIGAARAILARLPRPDLLPPREKAWLAAARALFASGEVLGNRRAFAAAMEKVHAGFPDDESATFLALALLGTLYPGDPDEAAVRERAGKLAAEVFARSPKHPGAAHYLIHAYDTPALAARALPAARLYATIAPEAFHARHMPAHIFSRLGMWKEALASCQAAWDASVAVAGQGKLGPDHHDFHSLSWLVEINFERGRRSEADRAFALFADAVRGGLGRQNRLGYVNQVGSYLARTREWKRVDELLAPLDTAATDARAAAPAAPPTAGEGAGGAASCHTAAAAPAGPDELFERRGILTVRARAAAGQRDQAAARRHLAAIAAIDRELHVYLAASQPPELVAMQEKANEATARALLARARGDFRGLLAIQTEMQGGGPPPGEGVADAFIRRESIGDTLLELGRAGEALAAYEEVVRDYPGRAHSMLGAARAARKAGKPEVAKSWYARLLEVWAEADEGTDGLAEARDAVR